MPLRENQLKAKLKRGEVIIGTLMKSRGPYVVEAYAKAGVDYLDMDAEHTNFDMKELRDSVLSVGDTAHSKHGQIIVGEWHLLDRVRNGFMVSGA